MPPESDIALPSEVIQRPEREVLTPEMVLADLNSPLAASRMREYQIAKNAHGLWLVIACSDARVSVPFATNRLGMMVLPSVAASALPHAFRETIRRDGKQAIAGVVVVSHFDGESSTQVGQGLEGCGGIHAKSNGNGTGEPLLDTYVDKVIPRGDTVGNTLQMWNALRDITDIPVVGAVMDHRTQRMMPVAVSVGGHDHFVSNTTVTRTPLEGFIDHLTLDQVAGLSAPAARLFHENQDVVARLAETDPDFYERQRYNDPRLLLITDSPKPARVLLPNHCDRPNESFRISVPRGKGREGLTSSAVNLAVAQASYPIMHALGGLEKGSGSFSHLKTILIHTKLGLDASDVREALIAQEWMQKWMSMGGSILVVETNKGLPEGSRIYSR